MRILPAWRIQALIRIVELQHDETLLELPRPGPAVKVPARLAAEMQMRRDFVKATLSDAEDAVRKSSAHGSWLRSVWDAWSGSDVERAWRDIHAAEVELLRLASMPDLAGQSAEVDAVVAMYLPATDSRRMDLHKRYVDGGGHLSQTDQVPAVRAFRAALREYDDQRTRVRSFRNVLIVTSLVMAVALIVLTVVTAAKATSLSLCFHRNCPTGFHKQASGGDLILVELLGAAAALLVGATSLSRIRGTATPYAVPVVTTLFKVPAGALTAVLGLLLIRGGLVPGVSLDSTAQVVAWALLFGAAQQTFTGLIDRQAQTVLNNVKSTEQPATRGNGSRS